MNTLIGRFKDWRHERRIHRLGTACKAAVAAGDKDGARQHWIAMAEAIKARSPERVARMERAAFKLLSDYDKRAFLKSGGSPGSH